VYPMHTVPNGDVLDRIVRYNADMHAELAPCEQCKSYLVDRTHVCALCHMARYCNQGSQVVHAPVHARTCLLKRHLGELDLSYLDLNRSMIALDWLFQVGRQHQNVQAKQMAAKCWYAQMEIVELKMTIVEMRMKRFVALL